MTYNELTYKIRGCAFKVHATLGPGLLESIYEEAMIIEMRKKGLNVESQKLIEIVYDGHRLSHPLRLDILVEDMVVLELKSVERMESVYFKQLMSYLKLADKRLGLLINFNVTNIAKEGIFRIANNFDEEER